MFLLPSSRRRRRRRKKMSKEEEEEVFVFNGTLSTFLLPRTLPTRVLMVEQRVVKCLVK
jgi:hypothetical protein